MAKNIEARVRHSCTMAALAKFRQAHKIWQEGLDILDGVERWSKAYNGPQELDELTKEYLEAMNG